jgi:hypothetical protein
VVSGLVPRFRRLRKRKKPMTRAMMTTAPPTDIPAMAPVESPPEVDSSLAGGREVFVGEDDDSEAEEGGLVSCSVQLPRV